MEEFTVVTVIGRSVEDVCAFLADVTKMPLWTPGVREVRLNGDGPLAPGSTMVSAGTFLGRGFEMQAVCTELIPGKRLAYKTTAAPIYLEVEYTLEPDGDGTRVTGRYRGESRGFFRFAEPLVVRLSKKMWENAGENLKELLEERAV
jgi:carbon monoxide dehydrogenase subunit G